MYASVHIQATPPCWCEGAQNSKAQLIEGSQTPDISSMDFQEPGFASCINFASQSSIPGRSIVSVNSFNTRHGVHIQQRSTTPLWMHRSNDLRIICNATDGVQNKVKFSREQLTAQQLENWIEAGNYLGSLGFDAEETDKILGKAFGWVHSPFWSEDVQQTVPEVETVSTAMDLAKGTGLTDEQLAAVLKKFPELLNCLDTIETNIGTLDKVWGIKGNVLKNLIIRNPRVLGYNVDCRGDCMAKCTRCWVRF